MQSASWFRGDVCVSGRSHTAVNSGEHMGARLSGVRVLVQLASCFVAKN